ncbi:MAG: glycosyltransferase family 4 protein [Sphingomonadales bacterium]
MQKVAVTGLRGIPDIMGGVEAHCQELYPRLKALAPNIDVTIYGRAPYLSAPRSEYHGVAVRGVPSPTQVSLEAILATAFSILYAWRNHAKVVHLHAIGPSLLAPLGRLMGLKVIVTHHGKDYDRAKWGAFASGVLRLGERIAMCFAHQVIAISPSLAADLKTRFPSSANRVKYIPNGVTHLPAQDLSILEEYGLAPGSYIMTAARLVPEKGLHDLIEAHKMSGTDHTLIIAGDADHGSDYARQLKAQATDKIIFAGRRSRSCLRALYENTALFVLPSYHEGLPIAALEAASCGAPILLSNITGNLDIKLEAKHYFEVGNVKELARKLSGSFKPFTVDAVDIKQRFNWDTIAHETAEIYASLENGLGLETANTTSTTAPTLQ